MELIHKTPVDDVPSALCPFQGTWYLVPIIIRIITRVAFGVTRVVVRVTRVVFRVTRVVKYCLLEIQKIFFFSRLSNCRR